MADGSSAPTITSPTPPGPLEDRTELDVASRRHRPRVEGGDLVLVGVGGADETGGVVGVAHVDGVGVDAVAIRATTGSRRSPHPPPPPGAAAGRAPRARRRCWHRPRRDGRRGRRRGRTPTASSASRRSVRRRSDPANVIRWSVATDPVTAIRPRTLRAAWSDMRPLTDARPAAGSDQLKESPQAQEPVAFGLSIVKPCFSIVSTKSIVAPPR